MALLREFHTVSDSPYEDERKQHPNPVTISLETRVPSKWRVIDLETGDIWRWNEYGERKFEHVNGTFSLKERPND